MNRILAYITLLSTILMVVCSFTILFVFQEEFNQVVKSGEHIYIEPAGYSFGIWFIIYLGFMAMGMYQCSPKQWNDPSFIQARPYIILNSIANVAWIVVIINRNQGISLICSIIILATLIQLARFFEIGKASTNPWEQYLVKIPISAYFGWITLMFPINIVSHLITETDWLGDSMLNTEMGSTLILIATFILAFLLFLKNQVNLNYILVVIWGLIAIFVANLYTSQLVAFSALGLSIGLLVTYFLVERQQMELNKIQMELTALRNQVNPHFLFNNLNTLSNLIPTDSQSAHRYLEELAKFYRYIVSQRDDHLIPLQDELDGVKHYLMLLKERFGENLQIEIECGQVDGKTILPLSLQMLIENAVKHNIISQDNPLKIKISIPTPSNKLTVENNINERIHTLESTGIGLSNIRKRYKYLTKEKVEIRTESDKFCVTIPLIDRDHAYFDN